MISTDAMWEVDNRTPLAAQGYFVRDRDGREHWVVAVKGVFEIRNDGLTSIAERQAPIRLVPDYADDEAGEMLADADICPFRAKTDFIMRGVACLPDQKPTRSFEAGVAVGTGWRKEARIVGRRQLRKQRGRLTVEEEPLTELELGWRDSLGGRDVAAPDDEAVNTANPLGKGWTAQWPRLPDDIEIDLASIESLHAPIEIDGPLPEPYGFGAVQPHWSPRRELAGTYDDDWRKARRPLLPEDFDDRFHQAAPADQVLDLKGGETVSASNLHPDGPFTFRLPQLILETRTWMRGRSVEGRFGLKSVLLDTSAKTVEMVWNSAFACERDTDIERSRVRLRQMAGVA